MPLELQVRHLLRKLTWSEAGMLLAEASSAICVQRFDGSQNSAIHMLHTACHLSVSKAEDKGSLTVQASLVSWSVRL